MDIKNILKKYNFLLKKVHLKSKRYGSVRFIYNRRYNVILALLYHAYESIGKCNKILLFDSNKNVYTLENDEVKSLKFNEYKFVFNISYRLKKNEISMFKRMFKSNVFVDHNNILNTLDDIESFYETKIVDCDKENEILKHKLSKLSIVDFSSIYSSQIYEYDTFKNINCITKIEKVNEKLVVIRIFAVYRFKTTEIHRIYIDDTSIYKFRINSLNRWEKANNPICTYNDFKLIIPDIEKFKGTRLYHCKDIFSQTLLTYNETLSLMLILLENPIIEQLYKTGFSDIIHLNIKYLSTYSADSFVKATFGFYDNTKNTLHNKLGLNKYQFHKFQKSFKKVFEIEAISVLRTIYGKDLSNLDNKTFDKAYFIISELLYIKSGEYHLKDTKTEEIQNLLISIVKRLNKLKKDEKRTLNILQSFLSNHNDLFKDNTVIILEYYSEYINIITDLQKLTGEIYELEFKNEDNLIDMLENVEVELEILKDSKKTQRFQKRAKTLKKHFYENNSFLIICPNTPKELVKEGRRLKHCVADYTNKVIKGKTLIFFLRRKENIEKPYYTIEVTPKGRIKQVHGFDNCNIDKDSAEYKFLKKWAKKNNFRIGDIDELYNAD